MFALVLPALVVIVLAEMTSRGMDTKALAMLGVLSAIGAALRPLGAGTGGIELVFFLLVLGGRVYGPGLRVRARVHHAVRLRAHHRRVGPWLPFQMLASSWVGLLAGCLPPWRGRAEIDLLAVYAGVSAYLYGFLVNLWGWPFALGAGTELSYVAGDAVLDNLHRFVLYTLATSTWGWDTGRAITNVVAILLVGPSRARHAPPGHPQGGLRRAGDVRAVSRDGGQPPRRQTPRRGRSSNPTPSGWRPTTRAATRSSPPTAPPSRPGEPGYLDPDTGLFVITAAEHVRRGHCCANDCRHCPYRLTVASASEPVGALRERSQPATSAWTQRPVRM